MPKTSAINLPEPSGLIIDRFSALPQVCAIAAGGSSAGGTSDAASDLDLYVYCAKPVSLTVRRRIADMFSSNPEIGNAFFEPGDEWICSRSGLRVDIMYRSPDWMEDRISAVLDRHEASVGYTTCFWHNIRQSAVLFDRTGWLSSLKKKAAGRYPRALAVAIINKNFPLLSRNQSSYLHQVESALARRDYISVNHRIAAFLASYFDVLFAVNLIPHPGEKRLLSYAVSNCALLPESFERDMRALFLTPYAGSDPEKLLNCLRRLSDRLARAVETFR